MSEENEVLDGRELSESMDESILANLREIQSRNTEEPAEEAPEVTEQEPARERTRAPDGKFAKETAPETPDTSNIPAEAVEAAVPVDVDMNRAPSSWKPAAKAAWAALPEQVRTEIHRREFDFHNTTFKGPLKENADFGQSVKSIVEPYRMLIEAEGGTPEGAIRDTMRTAALLRTGSQDAKLQAVFAMDKQFNIGLQAAFQQAVAAEVARATGQAPQAPQAPQASYNDPRVDSILQSLQAQERERQGQLERMSNAAVEQFIAAKDAQGQPLYPFIDNVAEDMNTRVILLRRQNPAQEHAAVLKQAYEEAVWANPETRAVLLSQQQAQAIKPEANLRRVEQAKRASAVNVPKRGSLPATGPARSLEDTIRETARELGMF